MDRETSISDKFSSFQETKTIFTSKMNLSKHCASIFLSTLLAILFIVLFIQSADAHALVDSSTRHGNDPPRARMEALQHNRQQSGSLIQANNNNQGNHNRCQSGWIWFNNKCWVATQSRRDFVHAIELCKKMHNSTLPTIHSEEENDFLKSSMELKNSPIWIYARHNHQYNKTRWLDKSPVTYTRWESGQPSDKSSLVCIKTDEDWYMKKAEPVDGQTECVSFWNDATWGTQVGCLVLLPVICEKKLTPISKLSEGQNGTITSQFEQQQMFPYSAAQSALDNIYWRSLVYLIVSSIAVTATSMLTNQKGSLLR